MGNYLPPSPVLPSRSLFPLPELKPLRLEAFKRRREAPSRRPSASKPHTSPPSTNLALDGAPGLRGFGWEDRGV